MHQHNLGILFGGWSPDWPDGYGMMDELINGNTIAPSGNTNIGELNDPAINSLFAKATNPSLTDAQRERHLRRRSTRHAMSGASILPNVYATNLLYRNPAVTNVYTSRRSGCTTTASWASAASSRSGPTARVRRERRPALVIRDAVTAAGRRAT